MLHIKYEVVFVWLEPLNLKLWGKSGGKRFGSRRRKRKNADKKRDFITIKNRSGADCKSAVTDFGGPNPPLPTTKSALFPQKVMHFSSF